MRIFAHRPRVAKGIEWYFGGFGLAQTKDRFERAKALQVALDPIIDTCVRIGVNSAELESLIRVRFVTRLAETLPGNLRTGRGPTREEIGLAAGLNRNEEQDILTRGPKSTELRMQQKSKVHSKSERLLTLWSEDSRYVSTSGLPLDLPLDLQPEGPSFSELVDRALPHKVPRTVLKDLRRRGLVQLLPDEIVRYRRATTQPANLSPSALSYAAEQIRLLGHTVLPPLQESAAKKLPEFSAYVATEPIGVVSEELSISYAEVLESIGSFVEGMAERFGRAAAKAKRNKTPNEVIGLSVFTWRKR